MLLREPVGSVRSTEPRSVRLKGIPPPSKSRKYLIEGKGMLGDELIDFFFAGERKTYRRRKCIFYHSDWCIH